MYRTKEYEEKSTGRSVLQIALDVVMQVRGSCDRDHQLLHNDISCLKEVVNSWDEKTSLNDDEKVFDNLVLDIIKQARKMGINHLNDTLNDLSS